MASFWGDILTQLASAWVRGSPKSEKSDAISEALVGPDSGTLEDEESGMGRRNKYDFKGSKGGSVMSSARQGDLKGYSLEVPKEDWNKIEEPPLQVTSVGPDLSRRFEVLVEPDAWKYLWYCVDRASPDEVSGLGIVRVEGERLYVPKILLIEQVSGGVDTLLDGSAIASLQYEMTQGGEEEDAANMLLWWHSHNTMPAFFSGTDFATIERLAGEPFLLSLVVNCKREYQARVDTWKPFRMTAPAIVRPDLRVTVEEAERFKEDFDKKFRKKGSYTYVHGKGYQGEWDRRPMPNYVGGVQTPAQSYSADGGTARGNMATTGVTAPGVTREQMDSLGPPASWDMSAVVTWYMTMFHLTEEQARVVLGLRGALRAMQPPQSVKDPELVFAVRSGKTAGLPHEVWPIFRKLMMSTPANGALLLTPGTPSKVEVVTTDPAAADALEAAVKREDTVEIMVNVAEDEATKVPVMIEV